MLAMTSWLLPADMTGAEAEAATQLNNSSKVTDSSMTSKQNVTWDCIWFGSYPQREVIADEASYTALNKIEYNGDADTIADADLFAKLQSASDWDSNGDTIIDGDKYHRIKKSDSVAIKYAVEISKPTKFDNANYYYNWSDETSYHYFKYEPIKWRVLSVSGSDAFLLADIALDDQTYNHAFAEITWEKSRLRSWLNGYGSSENNKGTDYTKSNFINTAFTSSEIDAVKITDVVNNDNLTYGTEGGNDTKDKIFSLSESEVYSTADAESYGFLKNRSTDDEGRACVSSTYAKAKGVAGSARKPGNCNWWMRSPGYQATYAAVVMGYGEAYSQGASVYSWATGVRPALHLDISSDTLWSYAGTVSSNGSQ